MTQRKKSSTAGSPSNSRARRGPGKPVKAYKNLEFLNSPDARIIRILSEYLEPRSRFKEHRIKDTIVFFGSARARPPYADGMENEEGYEARKLDRYYEDARRLANLLTRWSKGLKDQHRRFTVCSGGGPGIMEAANRGASEAGGETVGLNVSIETEQNSNPYISHKLNFEFHYFFIRKFWFVYLAKAMIVFPGGFGTMDELFEILTLVQTEKVTKPLPIVLYGSEYWDQVINLETMTEWGTISPGDRDLIQVHDQPEAAFNFVKKKLTQYYLD